MRHKLNLGLTTLERLALLLYGGYGAGKTHLQGDFLTWAKEQKRGPVAFLNIAGEDGYLSLNNFDLSKDIVETVETVEDFRGALADFAKGKVFALAVDGATAYYDLLLKSFFGSVRYPDPKIDGERAKMVWGQLTMGMKDAVTESKAAVPYVFWVAPHDKGEDSVTGEKGTTPDLPGKLSRVIAGKFDFVGHLKAETLGPTQVKRRVSFQPSPNMITRQRGTHQITADIQIPEGKGGWKAIMDGLEKTLPKGGTT